MFKVGDLVQHKTTGKIGKVVGYGCRVFDVSYLMTLKVKPVKGNFFKAPIEDLMNQWRFVSFYSSQLPDPNWKRRNLVA